MTKLRKILLAVWLMLTLCASVQADPVNFMVGDYVFTRPQDWQWRQLNEQAKIAARLTAPNREADVSADVVFLETKAGGGWASATETIGRWRKNFEEPEERQKQQTEEYTFGRVKVTYFWQEGTYRTALGVNSFKSEGGFAQYGVIIDNGKNNVLARVLGKKYAVEKCKAEFRQMIEAALNEEKS